MRLAGGLAANVIGLIASTAATVEAFFCCSTVPHVLGGVILDKVFIVGIGGFIGASVRYWLGAWIDSQFGLRFPLGTFVINLTGSLLLGFIATITLERALIDPRWRLAVAVGFIGAYTTFSTFTYESIKLLEAGSYGLAALNVLGSTLLGLLGAAIGIAIGRVI